MNLKKRLELIERKRIPKDWLILDCDVEPTVEQVQDMVLAEQQGQTAVLLGFRYDWAWMVGSPIPWVDNEA